MPCRDSRVVILLSLSGAAGSSSLINFPISVRTAVAEQAAPDVVLSWLEKKYFSVKVPLGVWMNLLVVVLDTVDS